MLCSTRTVGSMHGIMQRDALLLLCACQARGDIREIIGQPVFIPLFTLFTRYGKVHHVMSFSLTLCQSSHRITFLPLRLPDLPSFVRPKVVCHHQRPGVRTPDPADQC